MLNMLYLIFGLVFVIEAPGAEDECAQVWQYSVFAVSTTIFQTILGCFSLREVFYQFRRMNDPSLPAGSTFFTAMNQALNPLEHFVLCIWGSKVWYDLNGSCRDHFQADYLNLYNWYALTYWLSVIYVISQSCTVCKKMQQARDALGNWRTSRTDGEEDDRHVALTSPEAAV